MDIIEKLTYFNLTRQEATLYLTLLAEGRLTGYEATKLTGISRSNTYTALAGLVEKGAGLFADCQSELECQQTDFKRGAEYNAALSKKMTPHPSRQLFFAELDHKSLSALANEILGTAEN